VHKVPKWTKVSSTLNVASPNRADFLVDTTGEPKGILGYHCTFTFSDQLYIAFIHIISIMYNITTFVRGQRSAIQ
jgi:hypothetical protein